MKKESEQRVCPGQAGGGVHRRWEPDSGVPGAKEERAVSMWISCVQRVCACAEVPVAACGLCATEQEHGAELAAHLPA